MSIEWTEESLVALVGQQENYLLECKSGKLLEENSEKIAEVLSKAVSGFANAQGGTIIIGLAEQRRGKVRTIGRPDGVDGSWPTDRLQRLVESNVEPPLRVRFSRVPVPSAGSDRVAFVLEIPAGRTAHQARDRCYYSRSDLEFRKLRDHEIRLLLHRAVSLSAEVYVEFAKRRSSRDILDEQAEDFTKSVEELRALARRAASAGSATPQRDNAPTPPNAESHTLTRETGIPKLSPRWRFDEFLMSVWLRNDCERTIRDYDIHIQFDLRDGWLVTAKDNAQPRGGFQSHEDVSRVPGLRVARLHAATLHPGFGGRLMPGMVAQVGQYMLLVPEGYLEGEQGEKLSWAVYLDDSPASRGEIDLTEAVRTLRTSDAIQET